jgi:hypothetical protein
MTLTSQNVLEWNLKSLLLTQMEPFSMYVVIVGMQENLDRLQSLFMLLKYYNSINDDILRLFENQDYRV